MAKSIDPKEPIAIIGLGGIFPGAKNIPAYWDNIINKVDSIIEVPKDRWDWKIFYSEDRKAEDKTYSKIGGFITEFDFEPLKVRIPPLIAKQMDTVQQLAVTATSEALKDAGYDKKEFNRERCAVIFGNAMGGPKKEMSDVRIYTQQYIHELKSSPAFKKLPQDQQNKIIDETAAAVKKDLMVITEDSMPGELSNVIAGRIANCFNVNGANFTVDAACAASLGALQSAINALRFQQCDMVITGGIDQMMAAPAYVKFAKIGALSPDGSRPFDKGANGFVMGEGAGIFLLKRLSDAKKDGDKIYALIRAVGASSDGKGKGITAPNPKGQRLAIQRGFEAVDYSPQDVGLMEAHGTSTPVGDVVEVQAAIDEFTGAKPGSVALGSIKSQIGHLKAAAGAASLIKTALAIYNKTLPPSINFNTPNPGIDWKTSPFFVNTDAQDWKSTKPRRANVSAFGFGGTNFHVLLEEATPETLDYQPSLAAVSSAQLEQAQAVKPMNPKLGGEALLVRGNDSGAVFNRLEKLAGEITDGPLTQLATRVNAETGDKLIGIAAEDAEKLKSKIALVLKNKDNDIWTKAPMPFKPKAIRVGSSAKTTPKIAFLFPGQGSQYVDMIKDLSEKYQIVADTFKEADAIMTKIIGEGLTDILFTKGGESEAEILAKQERIKQTEITQPAVLTADVALLRLMRAYGVDADVVAGHSLGEYGALVAAGVLTFEEALLAVSARGKEMAGVKVEDNGKMAFVAAPLEKVEAILEEIDGYVIAANKNCPTQTVIAGATQPVLDAVKRFSAEGMQSQTIEVSHAFHSEIVAPATAAYARFLETLKIKSPKIPVSSNVTAGYYPQEVKKIRELMTKQIAAPVEFISQVERMYEDGVRVFVEMGPKRALTAFVTSTLADKKDVFITASNHPKKGGIQEFNDLLATLAAAGIPLDLSKATVDSTETLFTADYAAWAKNSGKIAPTPTEAVTASVAPSTAAPLPADWQALLDQWDLYLGPVVVSGIAAGAPGKSDRLFRETAMDCIIDGQNLIDAVSEDDRHKMVAKNLERLAKSETGNHGFEKLDSIDQVLRLAGQAGEFDLSKEFGVRGSISSLMDITAKMGLACGILALKDAGIPLVRKYKKTTTGSMIPTSWTLPDALGEGTGVIMASAFPGIDSLIEDLSKHFADKYAGKPQRELWAMFDQMLQKVSDPEMRREMMDWYAEQKKSAPEGIEGGYKFSRSFLFRILSLGHAQAAQFIGAKGPCTQINAACASTTQGVGIAEDWIRSGRCERVLIISCDDITNETMMEWIATGFLASGATTTHNVVSEAALPFDRRRNGMIVGMGVSSLVIEDGRRVTQRGMKPLAELLATQFENSAYHVTRLNTQHVAKTMEKMMSKAEKRHGIRRQDIAAKTLFMSHETYTPAQGGSSAAEVEALKATFGAATPQVTVTNTKGFTGHAMGASLEDVIAIRAMNVGKLPPIANYKEPDPNLEGITLSKGGEYDCEYALRLGAGFGSQIAITLTRRMWKAGTPRTDAPTYTQWLKDVTGFPAPETEIVNNTLRVKDIGKKAMLDLAGQAPVKSAPKPLAPTPVAAQPAAATPVVAAAAPARRTVDEDTATKEVLALVAEKTGYPNEMLELDLDMEADLGIDTVKQAELIGIIREKYGIAQQENLSLKDYPTLRHVIKFVTSAPTADTAPVATPAPAPTPVAAEPSKPIATPVAQAPRADLSEDQVTKDIVALVAEKTGYPSEMLELDLDMEADLGIDTVKQAELIGIIREKYSVPQQENLSLKDYPTLRHVVKFVMSPPATDAPAAPVTTSAAAAPTATETPEPTVEIQAPAEPAPTAEAAPRSDLSEEKVTADIVALVADKTGYPSEMLELDLDMEADLGIDTVKQAELIGIIRENYSVPKQENLSLKDYPTLRHVVRFVMNAPQAPVAKAAADEVVAEALTKTQERFSMRRLEAYLLPGEGAAPQLNKDTAVVVLAASPEIAAPFVAAVEKAGGSAAVVKAGDWKSMDNAEGALRSALEKKSATGLIDLTALDLGDFDTLTAAGFDKRYRMTSRALFMTAKALQEDLNKAGKDAFVLSITRIDGKHGCGKGDRVFSPLAGSLTGLNKALGREFEKATVRALDFAPAMPVEDIAAIALSELGSNAPRMEIGYCEGQRYALALTRMEFEGKPKRRMTNRTAVLITGGGQGLGAELAKEIARRFKSPLILLGRTPLVKEAATWVRMSDTELKEMKMEMWAEMKKDKSRKATPAILEREFSKITKAVDLQRNIEDMARAGSKVLYIPTDLADGSAVTKAVKKATRQHHGIEFVIHAAGLEESKLLADKKVENFDRVVRAKMHGAFHLYKAVPKVGGQTWAFFSSIVARFGNMGQADYAAANDFLAKLSAHMTTQGRPAMTFDLTAFADVGMATRGGIELFLKSMGVDFMPPKTGINMMIEQMTKNSGNHEVMLAGAIGKLDSDGITDIVTETPESEDSPAEGAALTDLGAMPDASVMFDKIKEQTGAKIITAKKFSLESDPWLEDHAINKTPWVAGVMGLELMAESYGKLSGKVPSALQNVQFALPMKLLRNRPITIRTIAMTDGSFQQESDFITPQGIKLGAPKTHFMAQIAKEGLGWGTTTKPELPKGDSFEVEADKIYDAYFHGPSFQVIAGIKAITENELLALYRRPAKPLWQDDPRALVFQPLLLEAAFQACGYRDLHYTQKMTLPDSIEKVQVFKRETPPKELYVYVKYRGADPEADNKSVYDAFVFDADYTLWAQIRGYRMIQVS
jgi:acyl transferase domain-containing protein/NAD(P)-dependent dehydrogenase (short-subunit alcohol dehydrogenase family)/acyl carrier protein